MNSLLVTGGRVIDPSNKVDALADVLIKDGKVAVVGKDAGAGFDGDRMNAAGLVVCPGLIDLHVHLREPGQAAKETIATGTAAAARGGFTTIVCMPNTSPAIDNSGTVALISERAKSQGCVNVFVAGGVTKKILGEQNGFLGSVEKKGGG